MNREMASETPRGTSEQPRTRKRARYTQVACNECKRRKLKCSGEVICARCARDNVPCAYPANYNLSNRPFDARESQDEPLDARFCAVDRKLETLQQEMQAMAARLREMEATTTTTTTSHQETTKTSGLPRSSSAYTPASGAGTTSGSTSAALSRILNPPKSPTYVGPTSAEFGLGIQENEDSDEGNGASPSPSDTVLIAGDLLGGIGLDEALRLVSVYEASVGIVYPCVDLDSVRAYITDFFHTGGHAAAHSTDDDWFFARDVSVVKTILATALLAESHGRSERAAQLEDSVEDEFAGRLKIAEVDMKELLILALLSIFHSYRDDEVIAWRHIGLAVRGCMQLGLHRQETWLRTGGVFPGALQCRWASRLFWCIYVLDRKWSFGTGLPFAIQDSDMDTNLPEPGAATPYLTCMITYARLSTKIWGLVLGWPSRSRATRSDHCSYLDFQVQQWIQSVPQELRFDPSRLQSPEPDSHHHHHHHHQSDSMVMLQVLLALQANQLRILVYRQNLLSAESIERDVPGSSIAVETAKSTVHMLGFFSRVSDLYLQRPEPFNYFLLSALAALFLAVLHAPSRFSQVCRPEFYSAVDMVRRSSTRARTSRRLQKVIRSLKLIPVTQDHQRGKNAAAASAGAGGGHAMGHTLDSHGGPISKPTMTTSTPISSPRHHLPAPSISARQLPAPGWSGSAPVAFPTEANNGCEDLTSFFELAGGLYFDDPHIETAGLLADGLDVFQAEDEALTRVMAGLL